MVFERLVAALKLPSGILADHKFLFLGIKEVEIGIAKPIVLEILE